MSTIVKKQDLPPVGGYPALNFARIPPKNFFNPWTVIAGTIGVLTVHHYFYIKRAKEIMMDEVEQRSVLIALEPLLYAERDRAFLKQLRKNRDEENRLMKDVEGWKTGHYFSRPLYTTVPIDTFLAVPYYEFYAHADPAEAKARSLEYIKH